jgi:probable F420-dependent oxidoreductase
VKRLWRGETVNYRGPVGAFEDLALGDTFLGPPPKIWIGILGGPQGARAAASRAVDGVMLWDMMTPEATRLAIGRIRGECERVGRDPATLRICQPVVTAPEASAEETRALTHARMVTYLGWEQGAAIVRMNGWDPQVVTRVRAHPQFSGMAPSSADLRFHREDLVEPAALIPDSWIEQSCAIGSVQACVKMLQEFRDAGADEVATYGSSPVQNAGVIDAWRRRRSAPAGRAGTQVG